jgi:hypothetical protein
MRRPTLSSYRADTLFPRVERAVGEILSDGLPVSAPEVFVRMGMLLPANLAEWRQGRLPYLERVIQGTLGKINRVLRIISLHAHDLQLLPAPPRAAGVVNFKGRALRFSKTGDPERGGVRPQGLRPPSSQAAAA